MNFHRSAVRLVSAVLLLSAPALALDKGPGWDAVAKEVRGKTEVILSAPGQEPGIPGKPVAAAAAAKSDDWCTREYAKNADNAKEISSLLASGKIEKETHALLMKMNENAFQSVQLTCDALAGKGETISRAESDRRWCAAERAKCVENAAEVRALYASGKISSEASRDALLRMTENAARSVEITCQALGVK